MRIKRKPAFWRRLLTWFKQKKEPLPAAPDKGELYRHGVRKKVYDAVLLSLSARLAVVDGGVGKEEASLFAGLLPLMNRNSLELLAKSANDNEPLERYAQRLARFFPGQHGLRKEMLRYLFDLAAADGPVNTQEMIFLRGVTEAFGMKESDFAGMLEKYIDPAPARSPYQQLGIEPGANYQQLKKAYMKAMQAYRPDVLAEAGMPPALIILANRRMERITQAYQEIKRRRKFSA